MNAVVESRPAVPALKDPALFRDRCLVDGQWVEADSRARIKVDNPADGSLVGTAERIRERYRAWEDCGATGLTISGDQQAIELMAEITGASKGHRN